MNYLVHYSESQGSKTWIRVLTLLTTAVLIVCCVTCTLVSSHALTQCRSSSHIATERANKNRGLFVKGQWKVGGLPDCCHVWSTLRCSRVSWNVWAPSQIFRYQARQLRLIPAMMSLLHRAAGWNLPTKQKLIDTFKAILIKTKIQMKNRIKLQLNPSQVPEPAEHEGGHQHKRARTGTCQCPIKCSAAANCDHFIIFCCYKYSFINKIGRHLH